MRIASHRETGRRAHTCYNGAWYLQDLQQKLQDLQPLPCTGIKHFLQRKLAAEHADSALPA